MRSCHVSQGTNLPDGSELSYVFFFEVSKTFSSQRSAWYLVRRIFSYFMISIKFMSWQTLFNCLFFLNALCKAFHIIRISIILNEKEGKDERKVEGKKTSKKRIGQFERKRNREKINQKKSDLPPSLILIQRFVFWFQCLPLEDQEPAAENTVLPSIKMPKKKNPTHEDYESSPFSM